MSYETMVGWAREMPQHVPAALDAVDAVEIYPDRTFDHVVVTGMGGSSIGGKLAAALLERQATVPIHVVRDHTMPGFVGDGTLIVATSYSGDTAETLDAVQDGVHRGGKLVAITTGGRLGRFAQDARGPTVFLPPGYQPRAAIGWLFAANYGVLASALGVGDAEALRAAAKLIEPKVERLILEDSRADDLADQLNDTDGPIGVVGHDVIGILAERWAGQLNENAKRLAFHAVLPEMVHNQILGWDGEPGGAALLMVRRGREGALEAARMGYLAERARAAGATVITVKLPDEPMLGILEGIALGDIVSLHLAREQGIDPEPVDAITGLKQRLRNAT